MRHGVENIHMIHGRTGLNSSQCTSHNVNVTSRKERKRKEKKKRGGGGNGKEYNWTRCFSFFLSITITSNLAETASGLTAGTK